ncbi:hypothetical protein BD309DRAFT_1024402 [Dichomitus squalens]|uniref:Uncharacterized protein n=1 Tax=Dichomitus squalens TaxID=114155 RepID=A0A4Q9PH82_9APHY|nr:hypothetical protein BD309DRAFT_1024402 [Dichomitus squalens]TBU52892.1 hypothetical protein BD310DRAFT_981505 [Dichomitus squalens]
MPCLYIIPLLSDSPPHLPSHLQLKLLGFIMFWILAPLAPLAAGALSWLGFTASGVAAGSAAAAVQSGIYGAFTTGVFSLFQSWGATLGGVAAAAAL